VNVAIAMHFKCFRCIIKGAKTLNFKEAEWTFKMAVDSEHKFKGARTWRIG
jgi:hypothetical protein